MIWLSVDRDCFIVRTFLLWKSYFSSLRFYGGLLKKDNEHNQAIIQQLLYYCLMQEFQVIRSLSALAHESRLRVFRALVVSGPNGLTPSSLAEQLSIAPNALSFHLKELAHAELVSQERQGRNVMYRAAFPAMNGLLEYLTENCCQGLACTPKSSVFKDC